MMPALIAAIADDYTGASDLANTWRRCGLKTIQTIGLPSRLDVSSADAIVVSYKIRSVPAQDAVAAALAAYQWLIAAGVSHVMYKVCSTFDSTDQGNIGPVTDALRDAANAPWSMVTPAFPETRRTVYMGNLFVGQVPLHESPLRNHPLNPMLDANLVRVLAKQSSHPVGLLDLITIRAGKEAALQQVQHLAELGNRSIIADACEETDLEVLGQIAMQSPVSTGASGLGLGLARAMLQHSQVPQGLATPPMDGLSAILAGSCSARTLEQIAEAEKVMPVLRLDVEQLVGSNADIATAVMWAAERLPGSPVLIAASSDPAKVRDIQSKFGTAKSSALIEEAMGKLAVELVKLGVRKLVVAGGETSGAVVDHLKIQGFEIGNEIAPGVPALRTLGRPGGELAMALKSGNFGGPDFFARALSMLEQ